MRHTIAAAAGLPATTGRKNVLPPVAAWARRPAPGSVDDALSRWEGEGGSLQRPSLPAGAAKRVLLQDSAAHALYLWRSGYWCFRTTDPQSDGDEWAWVKITLGNMPLSMMRTRH